ncbi:MAG: class I SAM-dependent RNA methyltransferase [Alphaproteobacteria bacterium]|nr:class I SAM-dependent RNA methyltransferase [Alphaproteobacteria bacterium]
MDCRHHPRCPGCPLADLPYAAQLERKEARLRAALGHFPHLPAPEPIVGSAWTEAYRHRLKLPIHVGARHVSIGLYAADGRTVLDTPDCPVLADGLRAALPGLLEWLQARKGVHSVDLRVSRATGQLQLVLACRGGELDGGPRAARALLREQPAIVSVAVSRADPDGKRVMGARPRVVAGTHTLEEAIGTTRYDLLPGSFFQIDPRQAEVLHGLVRDAVGDARSALDLYAGVGAYALMLADRCERVLAVEEVPHAVKAAQKRAPKHVRILEGRVEDTRLDGPFDVVVLNPSRRGSDPKSLARIAKLAARAVYVSCGPETLARDLDTLAAHGLRTTRIQPIDLFPQTAEVESVVTLERGPALQKWANGTVQGPWRGKPSGAVGRPDEVLALLVGSVRAGRYGTAEVAPIASVASHTLCRLTLDGPLDDALAALARRSHRVAGQDPRTARFFAEKAGLVRPFLHVSRAGAVRAPLHGDLRLVLEALGSTPMSEAQAGPKKPSRGRGGPPRGRGGRGGRGGPSRGGPSRGGPSRGRGGRGRGRGRGR